MKRSHSDAFLQALPINEGTDSNASYGDIDETPDFGSDDASDDASDICDCVLCSGARVLGAVTDNHQAATDNFQALVDAYHEHNREAVADVAKHDAVGPWDERWWWKGGDTVPQQKK